MLVPKKVEHPADVIAEFEELLRAAEQFADKHKIALLIRYTTERTFDMAEDGMEMSGSSGLINTNIPYADMDTLLAMLFSQKLGSDDVKSPMAVMQGMQECMSQAMSIVSAITESKITDNGDGTFS